jgi:putative membrane protein
MQIPKWISKHLEADSAVRIEKAVAEAEKLTTCEIVPMIVLRSVGVDYIPKLLLCFFLILFFAFDGTAYLREFIDSTYAIFIIVLIAFAFLSTLLGRMPFIQRLILSDQEIDRQVRNRAELEFYRAAMHVTRGSVGILLFLSLSERKVVVLADKAIAEKLPASTWDNVVELVLENRKKSSLTAGMLAAIKVCSELLVEHFPVKQADVNELRNSLIIME